MQRHNTGFTIIELMVVIAIIALILSWGVPQFSSMLQNSRLSSQANELQGLLQLARSEASSRRIKVNVCGSSDQSTCNTDDWERGVIAFRNADENGSATPAELIRVIPPVAQNGITIRGHNGALEYEIDGTLAGAPTLRICDSRGVDSSRQIFLNTAGQSRVHKGNYDADGDNQEDDGACP